MTTLTNDHPSHTTTFRVTDSGFCSYTNPSRATIPLIRPHQCDSEGGRIRGVLLYTDSGNESFCLISWMGKYFFCLDVPAFIHNCLHFMLEKKARSSSRMSVSRAATTTSSVSGSQHECSVTPPCCRLPRGWL